MATGIGSEIGGVFVRVGADTGDLQRGLTRAGASVKQFSSVATTAVTAVAGFVAATAGMAAGLLAIYKSGAKSIDGLAKFSDQIGITTEALGGLRYAAQEMAGVANKDLDLALRRMTRRVTEAAAGAGAAQTALKNLGLDAQALAKLSPDMQFKKIADAMQNVGNQGQRLRAAFSIFDTGGAPLLNAMKEGSAGLERMQQEAERLGLAINRIDAAQVEAAQDAFGRMGNVMEGVRNVITVALAPVINELLARIQTGQVDVRKFGDYAVTAMKGIAYAVAAVMDTFLGLQRIIAGLQVIGTAVSKALIGSFNAVYQGIAKMIDGITGAVNTMIAGMNHIPKVDIPLIPRIQDSGVAKAIDEFAQKAEYAATKARYEFGNLLTEESAIRQVDGFFKAAEERAAELADTISIFSPGEGGDTGGSGKKDDKAAKEHQAYIEQLQQRLETLREFTASETELEVKAYLDRMTQLNDIYAEGLVSDEERRSLGLDLASQHEQAITDIQKQELEKRQRAVQAASNAENNMRRSVVQNAIALLDQLAGKSKAAAVVSIALSKALMIAQTMQATAAAVTLAYASQLVPGDPTSIGRAIAAASSAKMMGAINIGLIAATGLAQAAGAMSSSSGSLQGGASGSIGGRSSAPSSPVAVAPARSGSMVAITLNGETFGRQQVRDLIEQINEAVGDGARLRLT